jgi:hypothetical protein
MSESLAPRLEEYEAIESAVQETERGRWFLAEFARRNRQADTQVLLNALTRMEHGLDGRATQEASVAKEAIVAIAKEIGALRPRLGPSHTQRATGELGANVETSTTAIAAILKSANRIRAFAQATRDGADPIGGADALELIATDIEKACQFQDIAGRHNRAAVEIIARVEEGLDAIGTICAKLPAGLRPSPTEPVRAPQAVIHSIAAAREAKSAGDSPALKSLSYEENVALFT